MLTYILLSLFNGVLISLSRSINGRLSLEKTPFHASTWNHIIGFLFLSILILWQNNKITDFSINAPFYAYFGGAIGAIFVAINSYTLKFLGSTQTAMLVISGQMVSALLFDLFMNAKTLHVNELLGITLITSGVILSKKSNKK